MFIMIILSEVITILSLFKKKWRNIRIIIFIANYGYYQLVTFIDKGKYLWLLLYKDHEAPKYKSCLESIDISSTREFEALL